jgi:WD40 repeat protein
MTGQDTRIGTRLGKYHLVRRLGEGGMGVVYAAEDTVLTRRVALKILSGDAQQAPGAEKRFFLEARAAARLNHPNVVAVYDFGRQGHVWFIAMELVDGPSAQTVLQQGGPFPWPRATRIVADVCRGLAAAHAAGLIHRDIKPANILLGGDGCVKLTDFGLAKAPQLVPAHATHHGTILGTPHYMSPEQCTSETIDPRADLYSLGGTYHALLTGRPPYDGADTVKVMFAHCSAPVPDPRALVPDVPAACAAIVMKALAKQRADRFRSSEDMLAALTAVLATLPPDPAPPVLAVSAPTPATAEDTATDRPILQTPQPLTAPPRRRRVVLVLAGLAVIGVLALGLVAAISSLFPSRPGETQPQPPAPERARIPVGQRITLKPCITLGTHQGEARGLAFGGRRFVSVGADKVARVWDLDRLKAPPRIFQHAEELNCAALSPDGKWLATGNQNSTVVHLWDTDAPEKERGTIRDASGPWSLAFHPSGRRLAIGSGDRLQVIRLDADAREIGRQALQTRAGELWVATGVAFTPDGRYLGAVTFKPGAYFLNGSTLEKVDSFAITPREVLVAGLTFSADGKRMVFARKHEQRGLHELYVWEPGTGRPPRVVTSEQGGAVISGVAFAPGGRQVAHGGTHGGPVKLYDLETGESLAYPTGDNGNVTGLAFSPDGRLLAATCSKGSVLAWEVVPDGRRDK